LDGCEEWGICDDLASAREHLEKEVDSEEEEE